SRRGPSAVDWSPSVPRTGGAPVKRMLLAVVLAGLVAIPAASARHAAPPTLVPGQLTVGLDPPAVGFQVGTLRGNNVINPRGFEIDLAKAIAVKLGISVTKIKWLHVPFVTLFRPGAKPFDFAFEESTITVARSRVEIGRASCRERV